MPIQRLSSAIFMTFLTTFASLVAAAPNSLQEGFTNPPVTARPGAFWNWLNGHADRDRIVYDLQQMKEKGMSGAEVWDVQAMRNTEMVPAGPEFLSPESAATIRFALQEGRKLGLRMGMITSSGWNAGGTWVDPTWASKTLVHSSTVTTGPVQFSEVLPFPEVPEHCPKGPDGKPVYHKEVAVLAVPETADKSIASLESVVNLTGQLAPDGTLKWEVPAGSWRILRFVCTNTGQILIVPSPKSAGLFIDFLDPDATRRHLKTILDKLEITPENAAESGLNYLEVDSMELHPGNPWTDKFPSWFQKYHNYDLQKWLPALAGYTIKDKATSGRFVYDYRKTVSDLLIHSHYETGSDFLKDYGIDFVGEAGGPGPPIWDTCPVDALKALGNVTVPRGEFWIKHRNMFLIKEVASAAHIYGKPVVDAESFTTWRRWEDSPYELKKSADRAFAEGLNRITTHGFAHSPDSAGLPGFTYHAGIDINPNTTWWPFARPFMDYLSRCCYMLQQGRPVADVLWYYGDQAPNFFPAHHDVPEKPAIPGLSRGYDYDVINSDVILNRLKVVNGKFVLPEGTSYSVLAFPEDAAMPLEVLEKIESMVKQGGTIIGSPDWKRRKKVGIVSDEVSSRTREIVARLWAHKPKDSPGQYGSGKVYTHNFASPSGAMVIDSALQAMQITSDFQAPNQFDYIHRSTGAEEIYFVRNLDNATTESMDALVEANFRVTGKTPQVWDPATGRTAPCKSFRDNGSFTTVQFDLQPGDATFIVFSNAPVDKAPELAEQKQDLALVEPITLSFPAGWGAPTSITLEENVAPGKSSTQHATTPSRATGLKSWTESPDFNIRHFSGIATYSTAFTHQADRLTSADRILIEVDQVRDVASFRINGQDAGITWKPPYRVDITDHLKDGRNQLEVQVANMWHNRLVGDAETSPSQRLTKTNHPLPKGAALLPSGLIGNIHLVKVSTH